MKKIIVFMAVACLLTMPTVANAAFQTGNDILNICTSTEPYNLGGCLGYIQGVADDTQGGGIVCVPATASGRQLIDIVVTKLREAPALRHNAGAMLVFFSLLEVFTCSTKK